MSGYDGHYLTVSGRGIYVTLVMPVVPRKGDILMLKSLTRGAVAVPAAVVSKVEWVMVQASGTIYPMITVRRVNEPAR